MPQVFFILWDIIVQDTSFLWDSIRLMCRLIFHQKSSAIPILPFSSLIWKVSKKNVYVIYEDVVSSQKMPDETRDVLTFDVKVNLHSAMKNAVRVEQISAALWVTTEVRYIFGGNHCLRWVTLDSSWVSAKYKWHFNW